MPKTEVEAKIDFAALLASPTAVYAEGLRFFRGVGLMNDALTRLVNDLERQGIPYAVIGAVALNQHGYKRFTEDIDLLMTPEGLARFRQTLLGRGYRPAFEGAEKKYRETETNVPIEIITTGEYPGDGKPKPVVFPDPEAASELIAGVRTLRLEKLVELKLASGLTAPHRLKDLADVQEMISVRGLDADFAEQLDESTRAKYLELYRAVENAQHEKA